MIFYLVIMKYNLSNETYLPETISSFPGAPDMSLWNMLSVALFYNWIPVIISLIFYYPIVKGLKKLIGQNKVRLILTGFVLTMTTPIFYLIVNNWDQDEYRQLTAVYIAWALCFITSVGFYYVANKGTV